MARRPENEALYKIFRDFLDLCLIQNRSLLWPDKEYWTLENLYAIKERMIDSPELGNISFAEKLEKQMAGGSMDEWAIICDIYFVYFLPSNSMLYKTKLNDINWAATQGGLVLPSNQAEIWQIQKKENGFTRTGRRYHSKYRQFFLIILFAIHVKENDDSNSCVNKPEIMQQALDMILDNMPSVDKAYDMRHAFLYMSFPDLYERSISNTDKQRIVKKYRDLIKEPAPSDLDEKIRKIRESLSAQYDKDNRPFDFYTDIKKEWRPEPSSSPGTVTVDTPDGPVTLPPDDEPEDLSGQSPGEVTPHTEIQWLLLKLGSDMGLDVWVAKNDRKKEVAGQKFADLPRLKNKLPQQFHPATNKIIELIDVLWLKGNAIMAAFEIESTTSIYSGLLRMADLISMQPNIKIPLYIVAPDDRRNKVFTEVNRPVFSRLSPAMSEICKYISFSSLKEQVAQITPYLKYIKPDFLDEFAEFCEDEDAE
jgi:hypothetical protein